MLATDEHDPAHGGPASSRTSGRDPEQSGEDHPLPAVDQLAGGVEMASMARGPGDQMEQASQVGGG